MAQRYFDRIEKAINEGDQVEAERLKHAAVCSAIRHVFKCTRKGGDTVSEIVVRTVHQINMMVADKAEPFSISIRRELMDRVLKYFNIEVYDDISKAHKGDAILIVNTANWETYCKSKKKKKDAPYARVGLLDKATDTHILLNERHYHCNAWIFPWMPYELSKYQFVAGCTPTRESREKTQFFYFD